MENIRGIVMMVVSMAGFAMEDMFVKLAAAHMPTGQILLFLGGLGAPLFWALARREGKKVLSREALAGPILWRNAGEMVGTAAFVTALALTPISSASAMPGPGRGAKAVRSVPVAKKARSRPGSSRSAM